jgi:hypothetical protein
LGKTGTEIFLQMGLDSQMTDLPVRQSADLPAVAVGDVAVTMEEKK